jgi:hypothetical protein
VHSWSKKSWANFKKVQAGLKKHRANIKNNPAF